MCPLWHHKEAFFQHCAIQSLKGFVSFCKLGDISVELTGWLLTAHVLTALILFWFCFRWNEITTTGWLDGWMCGLGRKFRLMPLASERKDLKNFICIECPGYCFSSSFFLKNSTLYKICWSYSRVPHVITAFSLQKAGFLWFFFLNARFLFV